MIHRLAAAACCAIPLLAGCSTLAPFQPAASQGASCTFGANGADVEIGFTAITDCSTVEQSLATDGLAWTSVDSLIAAGNPGPSDGETEQQVCALTNGGSALTVMDAGGAVYGTQLCSTYEQSGWSS